MNPRWRELQKILQGWQRHENQTAVHRIEPGVEDPDDRINIVAYRTIGSLRQKHDFGAQLDSDRTS